LGTSTGLMLTVKTLRSLFIRVLPVALLLVFSTLAYSQTPVLIRDSIEQHLFSFGEIEFLEDAESRFSIFDVTSPPLASSFRPSPTFSPTNYNKQSTYWYRIKIRYPEKTSRRWNIEFFDQTIDRIDFFTPAVDGQFHQQSFGDAFAFNDRFLKHKNFLIDIPLGLKGETTYYFKVRSEQRADILVVLRATDYFFNYALDEYFFFGIFYGMILVFCFYNLLMFIAVRERHYFYYILYLMGIGLYEMSADGIAFQYLWPNSITWNQYATGFALYFASTAALMFAVSLLNLRKQYPHLLKLITASWLVRTAFLVLSLTFFPDWFNIRFVEVIPFSAAFYAGIYCLMQGYRPARFMVVGYSFLFLGVIIKFIQFLDLNWLPLGELTHYSLGFSFIMEMMFLSFAISDKIKLFRVEKERAQEKTIEQLHENQRLKDSLNEELEHQVKLKTKELLEKNQFIQQQNDRLAEANQQLARQSEEIAAMNALLSQDNIQLKHDVEVVTEARILSKDVDFAEFSAMYPDDASCLKFLSEIKWHAGYSCSKCGHGNYSEGRSLYSRRCTKCGYDESVTAYTLLQNTRLAINKAFYMIFLVYSSKGSISSHKLSEILRIRQSTCWAYSSKIKKAMKEKRKDGGVRHEGWDSILLTDVDAVLLHK
jgi:two-component system, sensor histidine kinase LadS